MVTAGLEKKELGKRRRNSDWWKLVAESVIKPLVSKLGTVFPVVETPERFAGADPCQGSECGGK